MARNTTLNCNIFFIDCLLLFYSIILVVILKWDIFLTFAKHIEEFQGVLVLVMF